MKNAAKRVFSCKIGADTAENEQHFAEILPIGRRVALSCGWPPGVALQVPAGGKLRDTHVLAGFASSVGVSVEAVRVVLVAERVFRR